ncbi:hypothetical protein A3Q56_03086, partial [Intoshia linei]
GNSALHYTIHSNSLELSEILLSQPYIDVSCVNNEGFTPLMISCSNIFIFSKLETWFEKLCSPISINYKHENGKTALHYAIKSGNADIVKILLKCNANIHIPDNKNEKALHKAIKYCDIPCLKLLLSHKSMRLHHIQEIVNSSNIVNYRIKEIPKLINMTIKRLQSQCK